ncbi:uncharacterized protein LOC108630525 [Ceratina calcarata]|uniref:Uncharacterized protein LOC108630525 n=1 Tax=Ceratina calcarata TaxID=156304 RepID=A0AAJ7NDP8_9HYME|nr:uncharacterized protein LOC108630525 [Ceratina calcarata]
MSNLEAVITGNESTRIVPLLRYLGNLLGIDDYSKNKASFWLLDSLALQTLKYKKDLNNYYMGVLVNWLTGTIRLLRDRRYTREEFFKELKDIFTVAATKISEKDQLPYWEEIVSEHNAEEEMEAKKYPSERSLQESVLPDGIGPLAALNIVIESIYDMYANELRYALIYAVFVEPIELHGYNLPFFLRTPRQTKLANPKWMPFDMQLHKSLLRIEKMEKSNKSNDRGRKAKADVPIYTPPPSLHEDKELIRKREFILPLIEANEAMNVVEF